MGLQYTWGAATDDLVAIRDTQGHHYYATTDRLGSVRTLARRDGTWQLTQRFDPHGRPLARDTAASFGLGARLRYGWTGREWDAETGFSYHRARYFDPTSRRWTQEDPIGYGGGGNLYAYASGSPLEARDPSGLIPSEGEVRRRQEAAMVDPMAAQMISLATRVEVYNFWLPVHDPWKSRWLEVLQATVLRLARNVTFESSDPDNAEILRDNWRLVTRVLVDRQRFDPIAKQIVNALDWLSRGETVFRFIDGTPSDGGLGLTFADGRMLIDVSRLIMSTTTTVGAVMLHEMGHAQYRATSLRPDWDESNRNALNWENTFRRAVNMPERQHHAHYPDTGW